MSPRVPWMIEVTRSKPMPVSTCCAGSGVNVPSGLALYWMKTLFQISMQRASEPLTSVAPSACSSGEVSRGPGRRSTWISVHGPQGPVSPIIQKLSFLPPLTMCTCGSRPTERNFAAHNSQASWSRSAGSFLAALGW